MEVPLRSFFETPTLAGLALTIEELMVAQVGPVSDDEMRRLVQRQE